jgi:hypothetical protein
LFTNPADAAVAGFAPMVRRDMGVCGRAVHFLDSIGRIAE